MSPIDSFKSQFSRRPDLIHLNNAGLAPISKVAHDRVIYWTNRFYEEGFYTDAAYMADVKKTRENLSKLIGCAWDEISFFSSTAGGINQFAFSCGLNKDDEVLMWDQEYSSHLYPWKEACDKVGAKQVLISSENDLTTPTEKYLKSITPKTKIAAFSWVQFQTGAMMDYKAVIEHCQKRGIKVFVDAMQGLGVLPCDLWSLGVDAVVGGSHKWLVSPVGVGFMAIKKELAIQQRPHSFGAYTYGTCDDPSSFECEPKRDATRYEPGSKQVLEITALGASVEMLLGIGISNLKHESLRLAEVLITQLEEQGFRYVASNGRKPLHPICNFIPPETVSLDEVCKRLSEQKINFAKRGPGLRISPFAFNEDFELKKLSQLCGN